jgi:hypothetical protein
LADVMSTTAAEIRRHAGCLADEFRRLDARLGGGS